VFHLLAHIVLCFNALFFFQDCVTDLLVDLSQPASPKRTFVDDDDGSMIKLGDFVSNVSFETVLHKARS
jgi:hypothetical protein